MSLKRSSTCHKPCAGSANDDLVKSLEVLFYVFGKPYQKQFPDCNIPTPHEFLGYARSVSDDVYNASRKTIAIVKFQHGASKTTVKKILYARPLPTNYIPSSDLLSFLQFIHPDASNPTLLCITTVYYAVSVYNCVQSFDMKRAIEQFCTTHMPVLYDVRHAVCDGLLAFLPMETDALREIEQMVRNPAYKKLSHMLRIFYCAGIRT
jgi:hypothetical protein